MATLRAALRFSWILAGAFFDLLLFPWRMAGFLFWGRRHREQVSQALAQAASPEAKGTDDSFPLPRHSHKIRRVFLSVGDISAEPHALRLMEAMRASNPAIEFCGFGGSRMQKAGCKLLFNPVELALFGFSGPAKQVPSHLGALWRFLKLLETDPPDLVVLLDYPGFNLYLARAAYGRVPVDYYICPQIWAWAPWRLRAFLKYVRRALSIFPFEAAYFRRHGIGAQCVGHPIADAMAGLERSAGTEPLLAILPGSRTKEIALNLPSLLRIAAAMKAKHPEIRVVLPHEREDRLAQIQEILKSSPLPIELRPGRLHETLAKARLALVKSGTSILEVAHFDLPMIVVYKFPSGLGGRFRQWMTRQFLIPPWFASLNLLANREIIPEFAYGEEARESQILERALALWEDGAERTTCIEALRAMRRIYDRPGTAARAAEALLADKERETRQP